MTILVDSCGWIEYFRGGPKAAKYEKYLQRTKDLITPTIILFEVFKKIARTYDLATARLYTGQITLTNIIPLSDSLAIEAVVISLNEKMPMADAIIYATALAHRARVVTQDIHFKSLKEVIYLS